MAPLLIGTIAHPLNRPRLDPATGRVTVGYGLVQPRVSTTLTAAGQSLFKIVIDPTVETSVAARIAASASASYVARSSA